MFRHFRHIIFFFLILLSNGLYCQEEIANLSKFGSKEGLASINLRSVQKDTRGFFWVSSQDALYRFDGQYFSQYSNSGISGKRLSGIDIRTVEVDSLRRVIWVLPGENGLDAIDQQTGRVVKRVSFSDTIATDSWNICMKLSSDRLWIGTFRGLRIYNIISGQFESLLDGNRNLNLFDFEISVIEEDPQGRVWIFANNYGILVVDPKTRRILIKLDQALFKRDNEDRIRFNSIIFHTNSKAYLGTTHGMREIEFKADLPIKIQREVQFPLNLFRETSVDFLRLDKAGQLLVCGNGGFYSFSPELTSYKIFKEQTVSERTNWLSNVQYVYVDDFNNYWLACKQGLAIMKTERNAFTSFYQDRKSAILLEHVHSLHKSDENTIFAGLRNGLVRVDMKTGHFQMLDKSRLFHHIFKDPFGNLIVSSNIRNEILDGGRLVSIDKYYPEWKQFNQTAFNSHAYLGDTAIILGSEYNQGIIVWNYKKHLITQILPSYERNLLSSTIVNKVFVDNEGRIWVLSDNFISVIRSDFTDSRHLDLRVPKSSKELKLFFSIVQIGSTFWISSYGEGIVVVDSDFKAIKLLNQSGGLSNNGVYELVKLGNGHVAASTNNGLSFINTNDYSVRNFFENDGLNSNTFEEACSYSDSSTLLLGGLYGFTRIDLQYLRKNNEPPQVFFNEILIELSKGSYEILDIDLSKIEFKADAIRVKLRLSALNRLNPGRVSYSWRFVNKNQDWIELGSNNEIDLVGLSNGVYKMQVRAANEDGILSQTRELNIRFLPKWFQTLFFQVSVLILFLGIIYLLYRFRLNQYKKQQKIRRDIANDLHDDLGGTLQSVKVFTNLAISGIDKDQSLQRIQENLNEATSGLRDLLWILDDSVDTFDDLISRIKTQIFPVAEATGIVIDLSIDERSRFQKLQREEKRNLFLIIKEVINNSIKYANATQISFVAIPGARRPSITIRDNGIGFSLSDTSKGYGLKTITYRANQIRYIAKVYSKPNAGVQVDLIPY